MSQVENDECPPWFCCSAGSVPGPTRESPTKRTPGATGASREANAPRYPAGAEPPKVIESPLG